MTGVAGTVDGGQEGFLGEVRCARQMAGILRILSLSFISPRAPPHPNLPPPQANTVLDLVSNLHLGFALLYSACESVFSRVVYDFKMCY